MDKRKIELAMQIEAATGPEDGFGELPVMVKNAKSHAREACRGTRANNWPLT